MNQIRDSHELATASTDIPCITGFASEKDHRRDLWVGVLMERIREAGTVSIGDAAGNADAAIDRFDKKFGG